MTRTVDSRRRTKGLSLLRYGVDAPYVPAILAVIGVVSLVVGVATGSVWLVATGGFFLLQTAVFLHTTLRGKHVAWRALLDDLGLAGTERILDVGCGRGAVLIAAAQRVPNGTAHGVDLWKAADQSGNARATTQSNAIAMGVGNRVQLHTADMTDLPFDEASFDVVTSSLAIHNIEDSQRRAAALDEIVRVLRPGGRLVLVDIRHTKSYAAHLDQRAMKSVERRNLGPTFWFAGPWQAASAVTAARPTNLDRAREQAAIQDRRLRLPTIDASGSISRTSDEDAFGGAHR